MIKTDHIDASNRFKAIIGTMNPPMTPPAGLDERRQGLINNLRAAGAAASTEFSSTSRSRPAARP